MTEKSAAEISADTNARLGLVRRNAAELIGETELAEKLERKKIVSAYVGRATTGPLHIGHVISMNKLLDLQKAGIRTKILLADIHAALDDQKAKWNELDKRAEYTRKCIELSFDWNTSPEFVRGSDYQLSKEYVLDVFKMTSLVTIERAKRAASEVTRMKNPKVSELVYPVLQALDEQYLNVDMQVGGLDQRHILAFAREYLPLLGYEKRVELMMPIVASMHGPGAKMSSSVSESHIKVYETPETIIKKINRAYCPEGVVEDNFILQLTRFMIFADQDSFVVERETRFGGEMRFDSYEQLERSFLRKEIHPKDLKAAVSEYLIKKFSRVRSYFDSNPDVLKELGPAFLPS